MNDSRIKELVRGLTKPHTEHHDRPRNQLKSEGEITNHQSSSPSLSLGQVRNEIQLKGLGNETDEDRTANQNSADDLQEVTAC